MAPAKLGKLVHTGNAKKLLMKIEQDLSFLSPLPFTSRSLSSGNGFENGFPKFYLSRMP